MSERHTVETTALVTAARAGDQTAQDTLVAEYLPLVYNIVGRALNGSVDVDDVVQDTMLRALDSLGALRDPESFRSWLVAIAMNQVRAHWNRQQPARAAVEEADEVADPGADFVDLTIVRLQLSGQRQETALATRWLEPDDRGLLSLWWLECAGELTRAEIAEALALTPQHTAVRVQRMKAQLEAARVVVRAVGAQPPCPDLRGELAAWDGMPSTLWRKRIARHARGCVQCSGLWGGLVPAEGLLAGLALVGVSSALLARTRAASDTVALAGSASALPEGGPDVTVEPGARHSAAGRTASRTATRRRRRTRRRAVGGAVVAACVAGGGILWFGLRPEGGAQDSTAVRPVDDALVTGRPTPDAAETSPSPSASPTPSASASSSPSASASPSARKSATASAKPAAKPAASRQPASRTPTVRSGSSDRSAQVIALVNEERAKAGCGALTEDPLLRKSAQGHSDDMAARGFFDHTNPDGADPGQRITAAGYRWSTYGENIAMGQQSAQAVMTSWMNSPGHRANILNCAFKNIGVGIHDGAGGPWWTQNFGAKL
ncbi:sigma-70 family RNA polymerase sigma factor [Streptomyces hilarionis]|uniref:sigma-70 family RNA polymerase sigma factor n=1 Tax=Streptomyces hilarionis TaxID=2839954 RepID=UPI002119E4CD|nr:sigma-70 family RNA polymerase sigma factor [Streptomyces hilarionis]MCQ9135914.1 sigma-70 family RNA polymerase sigma factor [Streptomyces hilarionis]